MHRSIIAAAALAAAPAAAVTVTFEKPGVLQTQARFDVIGVEDFDARPAGAGQNFTSSFGGNGAITGQYTRVRVNNADVYGGADGLGRYAVTFDRTGYTLALSTTDPRGINYFGYWLSALDANNYVDFYSGANLVYSFTPADVLARIGGQPRYYGNPSGRWEGGNASETYGFVNFFFDEGHTFDRVHFWQANGGGYESDNHTIGFYRVASGRDVETNQLIGTAVPEPATWALMIAGFGMVGWALRRQRRRLETVLD